MKGLPHAHWGNEMFQLKRDLGFLLGQTALFESIRKLIALADSQKELRLGSQFQRLHAAPFQCGCQSSEVHVGRDVLLSRSLVWIRSCSLLAVGHYCVEMPTRKLLFPRIPVIDCD